MQQLGLPRGEVEGMIRRCPRLLALSPAELELQLAGLEAALYLRPSPPPLPPVQQPQQQQQQLGGMTGGGSAEVTRVDAALAQAAALWPQLLLEDTIVVSSRVTTLAEELQGLGGPRILLAGVPPSSPVAVTVSRLFLAKPALLGIPVEIVAQRIFHLSKKAGRPATAGGERGSEPGEDVAVESTSLSGAGGLRVGGGEDEGGGEGEGVLEATLRGPDLLAVTSCFVDRRVAEIAHIMESEERGRE